MAFNEAELTRKLVQHIPVHGILTREMCVSEEESTHRINFELGVDKNGHNVLNSEYGTEHALSQFNLDTGQPYKTGSRRVYYSYMPISTSQGLKGGIVYIGRRKGPYILAETLNYRKSGDTLYMYSPAGKNEEDFREQADEKLDPEDFLDTESKAPDNEKERDLLEREAEYIESNIEFELARTEYMHEWIAKRYSSLKKDIPHTACFMFRLIKIPCIVIQGFCEKAFNPARIEEDRIYNPNCEWNMIYIDGKWRFLDITRDLSLGHGDLPAYNDFLASPDWFGMSHISIAAVD